VRHEGQPLGQAVLLGAPAWVVISMEKAADSRLGFGRTGPGAATYRLDGLPAEGRWRASGRELRLIPECVEPPIRFTGGADWDQIVPPGGWGIQGNAE
jgi:hypothetical protein